MQIQNATKSDSFYINQLIEILRNKMIRDNPAVMHRDAHPKQHGLVRASFTVVANLPSHLQQGIFKPRAKYEAWVRFSNANAPARDDEKKDIRGAAIKLMNIPGKKLSVSDNNQTSQDFALVSTPIFLTRDVKEFTALAKGLVGSKLKLLVFFLSHPRVLLNLLKSNKRFYSPLEAQYWSTTPYRLGDNHVVKYSLIPHSKPSAIPKNLGPDYLRQHMSEQLNHKDYIFDFSLQLQTNKVTMPIDDAGKLWNEHQSPFIKVATLVIPQQAFDSPEQNTLGRNLSFNPWHSLPAHTPLGGINLARRVIYETLASFRHEHNATSIYEPKDYTIPKINHEKKKYSPQPHSEINAVELEA